MEQTLVLVKPDGVAKNLIGDIIARYEHKGLTVAALKLVKVTEAQAKFHYAEHEGKPFFGELVDFITGGPMICYQSCSSIERRYQSVGSLPGLHPWRLCSVHR